MKALLMFLLVLIFGMACAILPKDSSEIIREQNHRL